MLERDSCIKHKSGYVPKMSNISFHNLWLNFRFILEDFFHFVYFFQSSSSVPSPRLIDKTKKRCCKLTQMNLHLKSNGKIGKRSKTREKVLLFKIESLFCIQISVSCFNFFSIVKMRRKEAKGINKYPTRTWQNVSYKLFQANLRR